MPPLDMPKGFLYSTRLKLTQSGVSTMLEVGTIIELKFFRPGNATELAVINVWSRNDSESRYEANIDTIGGILGALALPTIVGQIFWTEDGQAEVSSQPFQIKYSGPAKNPRIDLNRNTVVDRAETCDYIDFERIRNFPNDHLSNIETAEDDAITEIQDQEIDSIADIQAQESSSIANVHAAATDNIEDSQTWAEGADGASLNGGGSIPKSSKGYAEDSAANAAIFDLRGLTQRGSSDVSARKNYYADIDNPTSVAYVNEPVAITCQFPQGRVLSQNHLRVYKSDGSELDFQVENELDHITQDDVGLWPDDSLKNVIVWILLDIAVDATERINIKIFETAQTHSFTERITHVVNSATSESVLSPNFEFRFDENNNWYLESVIDRGDAHDWNVSSKTTLSNASYANVGSNSAAAGDGVVTLKGDGTIFREWHIDFSWTNYADLKTTMIYRVFANDSSRIEYRNTAAELIAAGTINGLSNKLDWLEPGSETHENNTDLAYSALYNVDRSIIAGIRSWSFEPDDPDPSGYSSDFSLGDVNVTSGWKLSSPETREIGKAQRFDSYHYFRMNYRDSYSDAADTALVMMNPIYRPATSLSYPELKANLVEKCVTVIKGVHYYTNNEIDLGTNMKGLRAGNELVYGIISGKKNVQTARTILDEILTSYYSGGTENGFYTAWNSGSRGWQFQGREMIPLWWFREYYRLTGNTTEQINIENMIHAQADATVTMVATCGGDGSMWLDAVSQTENMNAESDAALSLARSLALVEDSTRRDAMNLLTNKFATGVYFESMTAYDIGANTPVNVIKFPTLQYHGFNLQNIFSAKEFAVLQGTLPHPTQFAHESFNTIGQAREYRSQFNNGRRGTGSTHTFAALVAARNGGTLSDLELASRLIDYGLSFSNATGYHEHPLEPATYVGSSVEGGLSLVEAGSLAELFLTLIDWL